MREPLPARRVCELRGVRWPLKRLPVEGKHDFRWYPPLAGLQRSRSQQRGLATTGFHNRCLDHFAATHALVCSPARQLVSKWSPVATAKPVRLRGSSRDYSGGNATAVRLASPCDANQLWDLSCAISPWLNTSSTSPSAASVLSAPRLAFRRLFRQNFAVRPMFTLRPAQLDGVRQRLLARAPFRRSVGGYDGLPDRSCKPVNFEGPLYCLTMRSAAFFPYGRGRHRCRWRG